MLGVDFIERIEMPDWRVPPLLFYMTLELGCYTPAPPLLFDLYCWIRLALGFFCSIAVGETGLVSIFAAYSSRPCLDCGKFCDALTL